MSDVARGSGRPLRGRVALVTGASRGIGRATALRLAAHGADVAVTARTVESLAPVVAAIEALGVRGLGLRLDLLEVATFPELVAEVESGLGPIDILVNNAGMQRLRLALEVTEDDWDVVLDTNLRGTFFLAQAVGRGMVARGRGRIVNVASMAAFKANPERAAYNSSKAGVVMLTKTLAVEWGPLGLRVNGIAPTFVETELAGVWLNRPGVRERMVATIPMGRMPSVDEVAAAVAYLVSPEAEAINGVVLPIDGGVSAT